MTAPHLCQRGLVLGGQAAALGSNVAAKLHVQRQQPRQSLAHLRKEKQETNSFGERHN
jgi:hypothetical protein